MSSEFVAYRIIPENNFHGGIAGLKKFHNFATLFAITNTTLTRGNI